MTTVCFHASQTQTRLASDEVPFSRLEPSALRPFVQQYQESFVCVLFIPILLDEGCAIAYPGTTGGLGVLACQNSPPLSAKISSRRQSFWIRFFAIFAPNWQLQLDRRDFLISQGRDFYAQLSVKNIVFFFIFSTIITYFATPYAVLFLFNNMEA